MTEQSVFLDDFDDTHGREEPNMNKAGLLKSRLERMHQVLSGCVERKEMPGLVALVSHYDDVHVEALGTLSFDHPAPMKRDTIFRIASITKPISPKTSEAALSRKVLILTVVQYGSRLYPNRIFLHSCC